MPEVSATQNEQRGIRLATCESHPLLARDGSVLLGRDTHGSSESRPGDARSPRLRRLRNPRIRRPDSPALNETSKWSAIGSVDGLPRLNQNRCLC